MKTKQKKRSTKLNRDWNWLILLYKAKCSKSLSSLAALMKFKSLRKNIYQKYIERDYHKATQHNYVLPFYFCKFACGYYCCSIVLLLFSLLNRNFPLFFFYFVCVLENTPNYKIIFSNRLGNLYFILSL